MPIFVFGGGSGSSAIDSPIKYTTQVITANTTYLLKNLLNPQDTTNIVEIIRGEVIYTLDGTIVNAGSGISARDYILCSYNGEIGWIAANSYS